MPLIAHLPNDDKVQSTHTCTLDLPELPAGARVAHIIPGLALHSLLSAITICNAGCMVTFTKINCTIAYHGCTIICGHKCTQTGLWMVPITKNTDNQATSPVPPTAAPTSAVAPNVDATLSATVYAHYIHQCLCSLPSATLLRALNCSEKLAPIPGLMPHLIKSHLPYSTAINKGHMHQHKSNMASTQNVQDAIVAARADVDCMFPQQEICAVQDVFCFAALADAITGTMYTDIPVPSLSARSKVCSKILLHMSMTSTQLLSMPCPHAQAHPIGMCGRIVQELFDLDHCVLGGSCLLGGKGAQSSKHFAVNALCMVDENSQLPPECTSCSLWRWMGTCQWSLHIVWLHRTRV